MFHAFCRTPLREQDLSQTGREGIQPFAAHSLTIQRLLANVEFVFDLDVEFFVHIEDRRKAVERTLESNMLAYEGPILKINGSNGQNVYAMFGLSQTIYTDKDKNSECKTYPNERYQSYKDCDTEFVSNFTKEMNMTPFWATQDLKLVTEQM